MPFHDPFRKSRVEALISATSLTSLELLLEFSGENAEAVLTQRGIHILFHFDDLAVGNPVMETIVVLVRSAVDGRHVALRLDHDPIIIGEIPQGRARAARAQSRNHMSEKLVEEFALSPHRL